MIRGLDPQIHSIRNVPSNSALYTTSSGYQFWMPQSANFSNVQSTGWLDSQVATSYQKRLILLGQCERQFGTFNFQRSMSADGQNFNFIRAYTDAANNGVGVYVQGAGFSYAELMGVSGLCSVLNSGSPRDPNQIKMRAEGLTQRMESSIQD